MSDRDRLKDNFGAQAGSPSAVFIPTIVVESGGSRYSTDPFSRLHNSNIVWVRGVVESTMADITTSQMLQLYYDKFAEKLKAADDISSIPTDDRKITLLINSPGGVIDDGLEIYDCMQFLKSKGMIVETIATAKAMSMGSIILVGGSDGHRKCWPSANIMLHDAAGGSRGKTNDMLNDAEEIKYISERMKAIYLAHTDMKRDELDELFDKADYFIRGEEAVDLGIVDSVDYPSDPKIKTMLKSENERHWSGEAVEVKPKSHRLRERPESKPAPAKGGPKPKK